MASIKKKQASEHIAAIRDTQIERYTRYLKRISPQSAEEWFRRWLFAYASVHTSWQMNCKLYVALHDLGWLHDKDELKHRIVTTRAGMHNKRTEFIHGFAEYFWNHVEWFKKSNFESWYQYRDRVQNSALGIGQAKSAFVVELTYPLETQVICVDTHILQLYGFTTSQINERGIKKSHMDEIENHWATHCATRGVSPVIARWAFWDDKQGHADSRYWSFVFEEDNYHDRLAEFATAARRPAAVSGHRWTPAARHDSAVLAV